MSEEPRDLNLMDRMIPMKGGKEYLQVADRIVWFRRDYPEGTIETKLLELDRDKGFAMYHARITTGKGGVAEASGSETAKDFGDYIEKSETKAVGRALGYLGFGTASAGFEEGQRIVDAPQQATPTRAPARRSDSPTDLRPAVAPTVAAGTPTDQGNQRATERQVKFIWAIGQEAGMDAAAIQFWCLERYRAEVDQINRRDAADFIEALQRKRNSSEAPTPAAGSPAPLTEEQERVLVQVKEMAEAKETYGATKALVQTLEIAATDAQWTEIRRRWFKVREVHYPLTIKQAASQAG